MIGSKEFKREVLDIANEMRVMPKEIHLRKMKNKWASCSSQGRLTFSNSLLSEPDSFRHDVIVHELLHLSVPNHGKLFRALERSYSHRNQKH